MKTPLLRAVGAVVGFALPSFVSWLGGYDFPGREPKLAFLFILSLCCSVFGVLATYVTVDKSSP